jgi:hypothetical protein
MERLATRHFIKITFSSVAHGTPDSKAAAADAEGRWRLT